MGTHGDGSWRHSTLITHHLDHPPRVKAIDDELYALLGENGRSGYEAAIEAEYAVPGEEVEHHACGDGVLSLITDPRTRRLTHLVYGGCTAHQIRRDLVDRGLGSLGITWVYPPETVLAEAD